jgi:hypothetical protein
MSITLTPVAFGRTENNATASRVAITAESYIGDLKAELYSDSAIEAMDKALSLADTVDTVVYLWHTDNAGERTDPPFARISRDGSLGQPRYIPLHR